MNSKYNKKFRIYEYNFTKVLAPNLLNKAVRISGICLSRLDVFLQYVFVESIQDDFEASFAGKVCKKGNTFQSEYPPSEK